MLRGLCAFFVLTVLIACGNEAKIIVASNAKIGDVSLGGTAAAEVEETKLGLWDPSPQTGDEINGVMTYAFRPAKDPDNPKRGGTVTACLLEDIDSFNPYLSSSVSASEVQEQIFPRLMREQPDYYDGVPTFTPYIAERWEIADDNLSIKFFLRECNWSDGTPITAADIEFSVATGKSPKVAWVGQSIVDFIQKVEIHNDREFTVHYAKPTPYNIMDINDVQIIPKHTFGQIPYSQWSGYPDWAKLATKACGGPWVVEHHEPDQEIRLVPNKEYWEKGKPYLDRLTFRIFADMNTMIMALEAGEIDVMNSVLPDKAQRVIDDPDLKLYTYVSRVYGYAGWNCRRFPFNDARVRNAMTHAINRHDIVEGMFYGYAKVAAPFIIRSMWASDRSTKPLKYSPSKAEALLKEAGWVKGDDGVLVKDGRRFEFELMTNSGNAVREAMCERILNDLRVIGVKANLDLIDFNLMSGKLKGHDFQAYVGGWNIATKIDPKPTFHSVSTNGRYNYVNYVDPYVDELIDRGRVMNINDPAVKKEALGVWKAFQHKLYQDQPYTMLYESRGLVGVDKKFVNVRITALKWLGNVQEWWIE